MGSYTSKFDADDAEQDYRDYAQILATAPDVTISNSALRYYLQKYHKFPQVALRFKTLSRRMSIQMQAFQKVPPHIRPRV